MSDDDSDNENEEEVRSRTQQAKARKSEEQRLADLATALVTMSPKQLAKLELTEGIVDAVEEARRMKAYAARARQLRIVRRELRDSDSQAIGAAVDDLLNPSGRPSPLMRRAQAWVERFLAEGNEAVESFMADHAGADRQRLKGLIRNVQKASVSKAVRAHKTLVAAVEAFMREPSGPR